MFASTGRHALVVTVAFLFAGCGAGSTQPNASVDAMELPTVPIADAYPTALIHGQLQERAGCVYVAEGGERWLLLWPQGYQARVVDRRVEVYDASDRLVAREGDEIELGGGETRPNEVGGSAAARAWAANLTGEQIPARCGDLFWLVAPSGS